MMTRVLRPDRLRRLEPPFSWLPAKLLCCDAFATLPAPAKLLYCFFCLVADRRGVSYWGQDRIATYLSTGKEVVTDAITALCRADLIAFDGQTCQVLSLPNHNTEVDLRYDRGHHASNGPATTPTAFVRTVSPEHVRHHVQHILDQLGTRT